MTSPVRRMACGEASRETLSQAGYRQARRFRWVGGFGAETVGGVRAGQALFLMSFSMASRSTLSHSAASAAFP